VTAPLKLSHYTSKTQRTTNTNTVSPQPANNAANHGNTSTPKPAFVTLKHSNTTTNSNNPPHLLHPVHARCLADRCPGTTVPGHHSQSCTRTFNTDSPARHTAFTCHTYRSWYRPPHDTTTTNRTDTTP